MPEKLDRCVNKLKGDPDINAWAVCNASINEGGMGSGRKPYKQKAHDQPSFLPPAKTPRAKPAMPQRIKKGPLEARPLIKEIDKMIVRLRENHTVQSMPNTSGLEGDWPKTDSWTPTNFSVIDSEQKLKEDMDACEICGLPNEYHAEISDHPYIPNMKNEMGMGGAGGGISDPAKAWGREGQDGGMNNQTPPMQPMQPPQMPQQIPPPQPPEQEHGQQYTVSIPASLGNVKIGGKKVNEMIREIDQFIQT